MNGCGILIHIFCYTYGQVIFRPDPHRTRTHH